MKSHLILSLLALAFSTAALATLLVTRSSSEARAETSHPPAAITPQADLLARVEALGEENRELRERLTRLELRPPAAARAPAAGFASRDELDAIRDEVRTALEGGSLPVSSAPGASPPPEFTERVEEAMGEIRVKEAIEGAQRHLKWRSNRLQEKLPDVAEQLGLTPYQEAAMETALVALYEQQASYKVLWETGEVENREDFGEIYQTDMETFLGELNGFLTPQQYEDYLALQGDLFPGGDDDREK